MVERLLLWGKTLNYILYSRILKPKVSQNIAFRQKFWLIPVLVIWG